MALILIIDTSSDKAQVCLSEDGLTVAQSESNNQKNHTSFIHKAVQQLCKEAAKSLRQIDAIGIIVGPGSYTGLRIGIATAKGLSYSLRKPLISFDLFEVMISSISERFNGINTGNMIFAAVVDSGRNALFISIYNYCLETILKPQLFTIQNGFLDNYIKNKQVVFTGDEMIREPLKKYYPEMDFKTHENNCEQKSKIAFKKFNEYNAYRNQNIKPLYFKNFYNINN